MPKNDFMIMFLMLKQSRNTFGTPHSKFGRQRRVKSGLACPNRCDRFPKPGHASFPVTGPTKVARPMKTSQAGFLSFFEPICFQIGFEPIFYMANLKIAFWTCLILG